MEPSRSVRPPGRKRLHQPKKHKVNAGSGGVGGPTVVGVKLNGRLGVNQQRPLGENGARHYEMMANDEPFVRPEDIPNMLDFSSNDEFGKFRPRPAYFEKPSAQPKKTPSIHFSQDTLHSLTKPNPVLPPMSSVKDTDESRPVPKQANKVHHHSVSTGAKGQLQKFRSNNKRAHVAGKKAFGNLSNANLNSNS